MVSSNSIVVERGGIDKRINLVYSEEFEEQQEKNPGGECPRANEGTGYIIRTIITDKKLSEKKVIENLALYENDYDTLDDALEISQGDNFGFSFIYSNGTAIGTDESDLNIDIKSEATNLLYVNKQGGIEEGTLILKVW